MIKKRRLELGLSQLQLARKTGVPLRYVGDFEAGRWEGREREFALVQAFLRLPSKDIPERYMTAEDNRRTWKVAEEACAGFGLPVPPQEFRERVACTLVQALAWCRLLRDGAMIGEASPLEFGFWGHGLVDQYHHPLGVHPLPLITWESSEYRHLVWPQVRARSERRTYRLDGLTLSAGWCGSRWAVLQMDGQQNAWDRSLRENLKLPLLRPDTTQVHSPHWRTYLESLLTPPQECGDNLVLCGPSHPDALLGR